MSIAIPVSSSPVIVYSSLHYNTVTDRERKEAIKKQPLPTTGVLIKEHSSPTPDLVEDQPSASSKPIKELPPFPSRPLKALHSSTLAPSITPEIKEKPSSLEAVNCRKQFDSSKCSITDLPQGDHPLGVDLDINFSVDGTQAGNAELIVISDGPSKKKPSRHIVTEASHRKGLFRVTYTPTTIGTHRLNLTYGGDTVPGSPLLFTVTGGFAISGARAHPFGKPIHLQMHAKCKRRNIEAFAIQERNNTRLAVKIIDDKQKHKFHLRFAPHEPDFYEVHVFLSGTRAPGCPYFFQYLEPPNTDKISVTVTPSDSAFLHEPIRFSIDAREADHAKLHIRATAHRHYPEDVPVVSNRDGTYIGSYIPRVAENHRFEILWGSKPVPGSPFLVSVGHKPLDISQSLNQFSKYSPTSEQHSSTSKTVTRMPSPTSELVTSSSDVTHIREPNSVNVISKETDLHSGAKKKMSPASTLMMGNRQPVTTAESKDPFGITLDSEKELNPPTTSEAMKKIAPFNTLDEEKKPAITPERAKKLPNTSTDPEKKPPTTTLDPEDKSSASSLETKPLTTTMDTEKKPSDTTLEAENYSLKLVNLPPVASLGVGKKLPATTPEMDPNLPTTTPEAKEEKVSPATLKVEKLPSATVKAETPLAKLPTATPERDKELSAITPETEEKKPPRKTLETHMKKTLTTTPEMEKNEQHSFTSEVNKKQSGITTGEEEKPPATALEETKKPFATTPGTVETSATTLEVKKNQPVTTSVTEKENPPLITPETEKKLPSITPGIEKKLPVTSPEMEKRNPLTTTKKIEKLSAASVETQKMPETTPKADRKPPAATLKTEKKSPPTTTLETKKDNLSFSSPDSDEGKHTTTPRTEMKLPAATLMTEMEKSLTITQEAERKHHTTFPEAKKEFPDTTLEAEEIPSHRYLVPEKSFENTPEAVPEMEKKSPATTPERNKKTVPPIALGVEKLAATTVKAEKKVPHATTFDEENEKSSANTPVPDSTLPATCSEVTCHLPPVQRPVKKPPATSSEEDMKSLIMFPETEQKLPDAIPKTATSATTLGADKKMHVSTPDLEMSKPAAITVERENNKPPTATSEQEMLKPPGTTMDAEKKPQPATLDTEMKKPPAIAIKAEKKNEPFPVVEVDTSPDTTLKAEMKKPLTMSVEDMEKQEPHGTTSEEEEVILPATTIGMWKKSPDITERAEEKKPPGTPPGADSKPSTMATEKSKPLASISEADNKPSATTLETQQTPTATTHKVDKGLPATILEAEKIKHSSLAALHAPEELLVITPDSEVNRPTATTMEAETKMQHATTLDADKKSPANTTCLEKQPLDITPETEKKKPPSMCAEERKQQAATVDVKRKLPANALDSNRKPQTTTPGMEKKEPTPMTLSAEEKTPLAPTPDTEKMTPTMTPGVEKNPLDTTLDEDTSLAATQGLEMLSATIPQVERNKLGGITPEVEAENCGSVEVETNILPATTMKAENKQPATTLGKEKSKQYVATSMERDKEPSITVEREVKPPVTTSEIRKQLPTHEVEKKPPVTFLHAKKKQPAITQEVDKPPATSQGLEKAYSITHTPTLIEEKEPLVTNPMKKQVKPLSTIPKETGTLPATFPGATTKKLHDPNSALGKSATATESERDLPAKYPEKMSKLLSTVPEFRMKKLPVTAQEAENKTPGLDLEEEKEVPASTSESEIEQLCASTLEQEKKLLATTPEEKKNKPYATTSEQVKKHSTYSLDSEKKLSTCSIEGEIKPFATTLEAEKSLADRQKSKKLHTTFPEAEGRDAPTPLEEKKKLDPTIQKESETSPKVIQKMKKLHAPSSDLEKQKLSTTAPESEMVLPVTSSESAMKMLHAMEHEKKLPSKDKSSENPLETEKKPVISSSEVEKPPMTAEEVKKKHSAITTAAETNNSLATTLEEEPIASSTTLAAIKKGLPAATMLLENIEPPSTALELESRKGSSTNLETENLPAPTLELDNSQPATTPEVEGKSPLLPIPSSAVSWALPKKLLDRNPTPLTGKPLLICLI